MGRGNSVSPFEVAGQLAQASRVPVYGLLRDPSLKQGIIGRRFAGIFSEIGQKTAAPQPFRVPRGREPAQCSRPAGPGDQPTSWSTWHALQKNGHVVESRIPTEATVRYRDPNLVGAAPQPDPWQRLRSLACS